MLHDDGDGYDDDYDDGGDDDGDDDGDAGDDDDDDDGDGDDDDDDRAACRPSGNSTRADFTQVVQRLIAGVDGRCLKTTACEQMKLVYLMPQQIAHNRTEQPNSVATQ